MVLTIKYLLVIYYYIIISITTYIMHRFLHILYYTFNTESDMQLLGKFVPFYIH